ncbi:MAG: hypothetical protein AVDCRST_MAG73-1280 [uncultured Thermomicrobiales bacterium]|uniref:Uncharacterized protein n=1 Tax=uncultured Thermomicrobiales bacterium TaxID=1645740 RepID=A0A6J4TZD1_9BACT|nr:MAG: hypothetical protein AVDCRST_MAG73-1280 [uncultured Thermomicrobiales bacterium]
MRETAITFDFHNTLASCDAWFQLEIAELPTAYLAWRAERTGDPAPPGILDAARAAYRALRREITEHGRELSAERCVATVLQRLDRPVDDADIAAGVEALMRATLPDARLLPGAAATVRALAAAGVPLGIVSSAVYHPFLEWFLAGSGLRDAFRVVTTSASAGYYKSRPEIYAAALAALDVPADRAVHVGDSYRWDVQGAQRAGMRTVWIGADGASGGPTAADGPSPDLVLANLEQAAPPLLALLGRTVAP